MNRTPTTGLIPMPFTQTFLNTSFDRNSHAGQQAFDHIMAEKEAGKRPVLELPERTDFLDALQPIADDFRQRFETVLILGTGGSSLGGQTMVALAQDQFGPQVDAPHLVFMDNIDPHTFEQLRQTTDWGSTGVIAISKSGGTAETICQLLTLFDDMGDTIDKSKHVLVITEDKPSTLTELAQTHNLKTLAHNPNIGGRFAALSLVGMLPAMIAGLDAHQILEGAAEALADPSASIAGAAWTMHLYEQGIPLSVMMPYCDRLNTFCKWYRQLWAESLGKDGKGITPIAAFGTVDQHSQLQLYLDGPKDKMFTVLTLPHSAQGPVLSGADFDGKTIGDLMQAMQNATVQTLVNNDCPTRTFALADADEFALGGLMMHFMLETMITARMMGVNAFDQPAVEEGKILAKKYLSGDLAA